MIFIKDWKVVLLGIILLSISNYPSIYDGGMQNTAYSIITFNAKNHSVPNGLFEVENFIYNHSKQFFYIGIPPYLILGKTPLYSDLLPNVVEISNFSSTYLASYGIKYVVTTEKINQANLTLVYTSGQFMVYNVDNFKSVAHSNDSYLNVSVTPYKIIVKGNGSEAYFINPSINGPSGLWNTTRNGLYLVIPMKNGIGIITNLEPKLNAELMNIDYIAIFIVVLGIIISKKSITNKLTRLFQIKVNKTIRFLRKVEKR
ncbi:hypothetical protein [Acidianus sp. RZ1]|uniref:hypothetical protein n=1 Tax=Acidianus sp. RZ1 TaxID=1540082 RepID=UPI0014926391|nr:hypothetical protein [Acidianus sp. RZ1]NON62324.1 hypothetical protein [Acidianus sp. RZ1]